MSKRAFGSREGLENRRSLFNNYARLTRPAVRYAGNYTERSFPGASSTSVAAGLLPENPAHLGETNIAFA